MTEDQASTARTVGLTGLMAVVLGTLILILNAAKARLPVELGNNVGFAGIAVGMAMMFFHATRDTDQLVRRLYGYVGGLGLPLSGIILSLLPVIISASRSAPEDGGPKPIQLAVLPVRLGLLPGRAVLPDPVLPERDRRERARRHGLLGLGGLAAGLAADRARRRAGRRLASRLTYGSVLALLGLAYLVPSSGQLGGADLGGLPAGPGHRRAGAPRLRRSPWSGRSSRASGRTSCRPGW